MNTMNNFHSFQHSLGFARSFARIYGFAFAVFSAYIKHSGQQQLAVSRMDRLLLRALRFLLSPRNGRTPFNADRACMRERVMGFLRCGWRTDASVRVAGYAGSHVS